MPGYVLTKASTVQCMHGGTATVSSPAQSDAKADGSEILTEKDKHDVAGCSFQISGAPNPCTTIEWSLGSAKVEAGGSKVLTKTSIGQCKSAAGAVQGVATVVNTQTKVKAL